jgi:hypothetical protein
MLLNRQFTSTPIMKSNRIALSYGLRYSMFYRLGQSTVNIYADDNPVTFNSDLQIYEKATPIGKFYDRNKGEKLQLFGPFHWPTKSTMTNP